MTLLSAYGQQEPKEDMALTHVGPGKPMGELMRRYWQPVCLSEELADLPRRIRILCEDLVVFRDLSGNIGCLALHCAHRGTSLEYGRIETGGIRCCFHGWLYDTQGQCVEMPCEAPGIAERMNIHQPGYPVQEHGGLVFIYMGPPDRQPLLPLYDIIDPTFWENAELRGMRLWEDHSIGFVRDCNWLQHYENVVDPYHLQILHNMISGDQFGSAVTSGDWPDIAFEETNIGVRYRSARDLPNGNHIVRYTECILPNLFMVANIHEKGDMPKDKEKCREISWCVPVDDEHIFGISIVAWPLKNGEPDPDWKAGVDTLTNIRPGNLRDRPYEEKQRWPDDMEAQESQRAIAVHELENLAHSDRGIVLLRRALRKAVLDVEEGRDPLNIVRDETANKAIETHGWTSVTTISERSEAVA